MLRLVTGIDARGRTVIVDSAEVEPIAAMPGSNNETRLCWAGSVAGGPDPTASSSLGGVSAFPSAGEARFMVVTVMPHTKTAMHRTATVDLIAVIEGSLWLIMEDGDERELKAGDVVVQNATNHAWQNRSDGPCKIAVTMLALAD